ncbi:hypothetical protein ACFFTN_25015 [Aminobacter aganoensis]|uniref:Uncharacterized protein n=1 Tax=Aminobacter aganoensis TaxID=83264 RepID=A0A7X0KKZ9_9HYPH|nr:MULTISPECIES: hypothetical protein [Aminobacter]MBB6354526.1 hypothetical protein [Aminobacter aganoensis]
MLLLSVGVSGGELSVPRGGRQPPPNRDDGLFRARGFRLDATSDHAWCKNKKRTRCRFAFNINNLAALAKCEQNRYKFVSASDRPAFIDDHGVMYHGSKFIAACRGKFGGQI